MKPKIGVYVCHCGTNIAGTVDVEEVAKYAATLDNVVITRDYKFMCSDPGQTLIEDDIKNLGLSRVVVASCSPTMHEKTFRGACRRADLNQYLFQMANIREHVSWVTIKKEAATEKAKALVRAAVRKAEFLEALETKEVSIHPDTLVIGGGIAGIQASLDIAASGNKVHLVEKEPSIGGHMAHFDKTFPTLDCAACILTPKMVDTGQNANINLMTYSEVENISGYVGNFKIKVKHKARMVDASKCNGCGECWNQCPATTLPLRRVIKKGKQVIQTRNFN